MPIKCGQVCIHCEDCALLACLMCSLLLTTVIHNTSNHNSMTSEVSHPLICQVQGPKMVRRYAQECRDLHFDAVELPDACADMLPEKDYLLLLDDLQEVKGFRTLQEITAAANGGNKISW